MGIIDGTNVGFKVDGLAVGVTVGAIVGFLEIVGLEEGWLLG